MLTGRSYPTFRTTALSGSLKNSTIIELVKDDFFLVAYPCLHTSSIQMEVGDETGAAALPVMAALSLLCFLLPRHAYAGESDARTQVIRDFLHAYLLKNTNISPFVAGNFQNQFASYPFKGPVQYSTPAVHGNQGMLEFRGMVSDAKMPQKGGVLFYFHDNQWHIRQVFLYNHVPTIFGFPTKSMAPSDHRSEPILFVMGSQFMAAWARGDTHAMLLHWFDWTKMPNDPVKGLSLESGENQHHQYHRGRSVCRLLGGYHLPLGHPLLHHHPPRHPHPGAGEWPVEGARK